MRCVERQETVDDVRRDIEVGEFLGLRAVPAFVGRGGYMLGTQGIAALEDLATDRR